jgi:glycosyltransferase involved in cell wall biosynthesis
MITLSAPSCATTHVPTIGSNVAGGLPTVSLLRSTLMSAARNTGWRAATTELVVFLDADDQLLPDALANNLHRLIAAPEAGMSYGGYIYVDAVAGRRYIADFLPIADGTHPPSRNWIGMHAVMYRRANLAEIGGFDEGLAACEDYDVYSGWRSLPHLVRP